MDIYHEKFNQNRDKIKCNCGYYCHQWANIFCCIYIFDSLKSPVVSAAAGIKFKFKRSISNNEHIDLGLLSLT